MEIWKKIVGFENYEISSHGRIKSVVPRKGSRANINNGFIKGWVQIMGRNKEYKRRLVTLRANGKSHIFKVHHLVLETFDKPRPDGMETLHKDGNALNNHIDNLAWGTRKENIQDQIKHGVKSSPPKHFGESHPKATLTDADVKVIREHSFQKGDQARFARQFNVAAITISRIRKGLSR